MNDQDNHIFSLTGIRRNDILNVMRSKHGVYMFDILTDLFNKNENDDKLKKMLEFPVEKPHNYWEYIYNQMDKNDNKFMISNITFAYLTGFSKEILRKMKSHSEKFKINMNEIVPSFCGHYSRKHKFKALRLNFFTKIFNKNKKKILIESPLKKIEDKPKVEEIEDKNINKNYINSQTTIYSVNNKVSSSSVFMDMINNYCIEKKEETEKEKKPDKGAFLNIKEEDFKTKFTNLFVVKEDTSEGDELLKKAKIFKEMIIKLKTPKDIQSLKNELFENHVRLLQNESSNVNPKDIVPYFLFKSITKSPINENKKKKKFIIKNKHLKNNSINSFNQNLNSNGITNSNIVNSDTKFNTNSNTCNNDISITKNISSTPDQINEEFKSKKKLQTVNKSNLINYQSFPLCTESNDVETNLKNECTSYKIFVINSEKKKNKDISNLINQKILVNTAGKDNKVKFIDKIESYSNLKTIQNNTIDDWKNIIYGELKYLSDTSDDFDEILNIHNNKVSPKRIPLDEGAEKLNENLNEKLIRILKTFKIYKKINKPYLKQVIPIKDLSEKNKSENEPNKDIIKKKILFSEQYFKEKNFQRKKPNIFNFKLPNSKNDKKEVLFSSPYNKTERYDSNQKFLKSASNNKNIHRLQKEDKMKFLSHTNSSKVKLVKTRSLIKEKSCEKNFKLKNKKVICAKSQIFPIKINIDYNEDIINHTNKVVWDYPSILGVKEKTIIKTYSKNNQSSNKSNDILVKKILQYNPNKIMRTHNSLENNKFEREDNSSSIKKDYLLTYKDFYYDNI